LRRGKPRWATEEVFYLWYDSVKALKFNGGCSMDNKSNKKKEPWRMIVGIIAIVFIVYMWVEKDIISISTTMPQEQVIPLIATTIAVSLIKVGAIAGGIFLIKWVISKTKKK
jgi:hypothetical protein